MVEWYYVQPLRLQENNSPYAPNDGANTTQINNQLVNLQGKDALEQPNQTFGKSILKNVDHAYIVPTRNKGDRKVHALN